MSDLFDGYKWPMANPDHKPYKHQVETSEFLLKNPKCFVLNDMGCVDSETEFLSPKGWVKISDWKGEEVLQWCIDTKQTSFVKPLNYIKKPCDNFLSFDNGKMMLSDEHRVVGVYQDGSKVKSALAVSQGDRPWLYKSFKGPNRQGINYTDSEIRLMIAYFADGTLVSNTTTCVRLSNKSKIERLRDLLIDTGTEFHETYYESDKKTNFRFKTLLHSQQFDDIWYECTAHQLAVVCDEIWRWDGRKKEGRHNFWEFSTMRKCSADFIQYAFNSRGYNANILSSTKKYKYKANTPRTRYEGEYTTMHIVAASMMKDKLYKPAKSERVYIGDGYKYCFEVPDTFWVMRRNGSITVTGNTGKTLSALWSADFLMQKGVIKRVLVLGPLSTVYSVWANEIKANFPHIKYAVAHGNKSSDRYDAVNSPAKIVIMNHDGIKSYNDLIMKGGFDLLIIDELTAYKNVSTARWKAARKVAAKCKGIWGMTAEPTPNSPVEAFGQARLVNDANPFLPKFLTKFRDMVEIKVSMFVTIPRDDADKTVFKVLQPAIRFKRDDCVDIPECQYIDLEIPMTDKQSKAYKEMMSELLVEYERGEITSANSAVKFTKLLQISCGWVKDDSGNVFELEPSNRLDEAFEIFQNSHRQKLVIASAFKASIKGIHEYFAKKGVKVDYITGDVKAEDRAKKIHSFQHGDLQVLVIQPQAASHGITLTAASTLLWFSLIPSGETYNQMNGRITRIGQNHKQTILHMIGSKAEKRILTILKSKGVMSKEILGLFEETL